MLNSKINNWAVELEMFNIQFEHISGIQNTLTDTLMRIVIVDPDMKPVPEKDGYKFGYSCFEELPPAEVFNADEAVTKEVKLHSETDTAIPEVKCTLPVPTAKLQNLQLKDSLCQKKAKQENTNPDTSKLYYIDTDGI